MESVTTEQLELLKFPIGRFVRGTCADTPERVAICVAALEGFPARLRAAVEDLGDGQLDTPYRPGGWTVRQVTHHLADSHMNALIRFKLALSEDNPTIKPYLQDPWSTQPDMALAVEPSLTILDGVHIRWVALLKGISMRDLERTYFHPEQQRAMALSEALELYVWHSAHHLAHITGLAAREGW
jgi:uncharacterized damage-inducible protein DinB